MMEKARKQKSVYNRPIQFQNYDPINILLENTDKFVVVLEPKSPLHYIV